MDRTEGVSDKFASLDLDKGRDINSYESVASGRSHNLLLERLLDRKEDVVFVGESDNRTLPIALAVMRGSFDGIWASSPERALFDEDRWMPLKETVEKTRERALVNRLWQQELGIRPRIPRPETLFERMDLYWQESVAGRLPIDVPLSIPAKHLGVQGDHRSVWRKGSLVEGKVRNVWFQCPWVYNVYGRGGTSDLILDFLLEKSRVQADGDALYLGIVTDQRYVCAYNIDRAVTSAKNAGYEVIEDETFIQKCIELGYVHASKTGKDIHRTVIGKHRTYVFVKRGDGRASKAEKIKTQILHREALLNVLACVRKLEAIECDTGQNSSEAARLGAQLIDVVRNAAIDEKAVGVELESMRNDVGC